MRLLVVGATGSLGRGQPRVLRSGDKGRVGQVSRQGLARVLIDAAERRTMSIKRSSWAHSAPAPSSGEPRLADERVPAAATGTAVCRFRAVTMGV